MGCTVWKLCNQIWIWSCEYWKYRKKNFIFQEILFRQIVDFNHQVTLNYKGLLMLQQLLQEYRQDQEIQQDKYVQLYGEVFQYFLSALCIVIGEKMCLSIFLNSLECLYEFKKVIFCAKIKKCNNNCDGQCIQCKKSNQSRLQGFTFINNASDFDYNSRQFSDFQDNMKPIKELCNLTSDIRWRSMI